MVRGSSASKSKTFSSTLLYGSKFHRLKMSRGQQGIGISAVGMYGLITTGKPMVIHTRPHAQKAGSSHRAGDEHQNQSGGSHHPQG